MKPWDHAVSSVRRYGGKPEDYIEIHDFMDSTKASFADIRHRAILHNTFGIYIVERVFGHILVNSEGKEVHVRNIAENHVTEDCAGRIPTIADWLHNMNIQPWMHGSSKPEVEGGRPGKEPLYQLQEKAA